MGGPTTPLHRHMSYDRLRTMVHRVKVELGCAQCEYDTHPDALEWDHINGGGTSHSGTGISSLPMLLDRLSDPNIQLLCGNCHNIKSNAERRARREAAGAFLWRREEFKEASEDE